MNISEVHLKEISYILMFLFITLIIPLHLFPCFIAGLLTYEIIVLLTPLFERLFSISNARWIVIILIAIFTIIIMTISIISIISFLNLDIKRSIDINAEINRVLADLKNHIPKFFPYFLPKNTEELKNQLFTLIESNLVVFSNMCCLFLHGIITVFIGFIIGVMISLYKPSGPNTYFMQQLLERLNHLYQAFHKIIFAQIKVSLVNTILTSMIILLFFPLFNIYLPLSKTLIIITFIFGLLPIVGNLISNFMIIVSAFSVSLNVGGIMILYLVLIHKFEYFLNAGIMSSSINTKFWELLLAMLIFEAAFGLEGLVAAPIYYAYLKFELRAQQLI